MEGDEVLGADGQPWSVAHVDPRVTTHKVTVTHDGKIFTFHPEHALPVQRKRGETGHAIDLLQQAFGPLEFLS